METRRPVIIGESSGWQRQRLVDQNQRCFRSAMDFIPPAELIMSDRLSAVHHVLMEVFILPRRPVFINNARGGERFSEVVHWNSLYRVNSVENHAFTWRSRLSNQVRAIDVRVEAAIEGHGGWA